MSTDPDPVADRDRPPEGDQSGTRAEDAPPEGDQSGTRAEDAPPEGDQSGTRAEDATTADATPCAYTDYTSGEAVPDLPATGADAEGLEAAVWDALYGVEDPEMPVSIVDLGLIYGVTVADGRARVDMTLTYSGCPAREMLTDDVREAAASVEDVDGAEVRLVWNPPWTVEMVTDRGREHLQEFGLSV